MKNKVGVAILIGGKSARMGQRKDRLKESGSDVTFLLRKLIEFEDFRYKFVSLNEDETDVFDLCREHGYIPVVDDEDVRGIGPMGGMISVLRRMKEEGCEAVVMVAVDMPFFNRDCVMRLVDAYKGEDILMSVTSGGMEPLASVYGSSALKTYENCVKISHYRLNSVINELNCKEIMWDDDHVFCNVNTPEDYDRLIGKP